MLGGVHLQSTGESDVVPDVDDACQSLLLIILTANGLPSHFGFAVQASDWQN